MRYILIAILCIGLNITNPSKNDFIEFASLQIKKKYPELDFKPESSATGLEKIISGLGNTMVSNLCKNAKSHNVTRVQCDQMARLIFNIWPFTTVKIAKVGTNVGPSTS